MSRVPRRPRPRLAVLATAVLATASVAAGPAVAGPAKSRFRAPGGTYKGARVSLLFVSSRSISLVDIRFRCRGRVDGRTGLDEVAVRRTRTGYVFSENAHGSVTYSDHHPDQNAVVDVTGRFSRDARRATGRFRIKAPHCRATGRVTWGARR